MTTKELYTICINSTGITTDSRKVVEGNLFFALKGPNFNGNEYAKEALDKGCKYAIIDNKDYANNKCILVDNALYSLQNLSAYHREKLHIPVIGITGTNGKTTTKELVFYILQKKYKVHATKGNLNNHIGVPLTLLSIPKDYEIAIVEMGANHRNEITKLCQIAKPDYGLITNIGKAHIEGFMSLQGVIDAKKELYEYLVAHNNTVFLNSDNELLKNLIKHYTGEIITYGTKMEAMVRGAIKDMNPYLRVSIISDYYSIPDTSINTNFTGSYNLENILAAIAIGLYCNIKIEDIIDAIRIYLPTNHRSQVVEHTKLNNSLILDFYNANPSSMQLALSSYFSIPSKKKTIILGDMLELGKTTENEHRNIIHYVQKQKPDRAILIGNTFYDIATRTDKILTFRTIKDAYNYIQKNPIKESLILIKGSRKMKLEEIVELL